MSCGRCSSGCCSTGLVLDSPAVKQVLYGSATVVEMMSAVYSALSSSSSPRSAPFPPPSALPPSLPPSRSLALARSLAPVCKCVIEAKYGAVGCRRRSSRIRPGRGVEGGHPPAGGRASGLEPCERTAGGQPSPLTLQCSWPVLGGLRVYRRVSPRLARDQGAGSGREDTARGGQFCKVWIGAGS